MQVYEYTLHFCDSSTAEKVGTRLLLRRSFRSWPLLPALIKSAGIVKVSVDSLQKMLEIYRCQLRKSTSKSAKIRALLKLPDVVSCTTDQEREKVDKLLTDMDARRNKRQNNTAEAPQEDDGEEAIFY